jgi:hypothetical protein
MTRIISWPVWKSGKGTCTPGSACPRSWLYLNAKGADAPQGASALFHFRGVFNIIDPETRS